MLKVGQKVSVKIVKVSDEGLNVRYTSKEGIVRIIDIEWDAHGILNRIGRNYKPGMNIDVMVMAVDGDRFLGSIKHLNPEKNPWRTPGRYKIGMLFDGVVESIRDFGLFVRLETGAVGLCQQYSSSYAVGDRVRVSIKSSDPKLEKLLLEIVTTKGDATI